MYSNQSDLKLKPKLSCATLDLARAEPKYLFPVDPLLFSVSCLDVDGTSPSNPYLTHSLTAA